MMKQDKEVRQTGREDGDVGGLGRRCRTGGGRTRWPKAIENLFGRKKRGRMFRTGTALFLAALVAASQVSLPEGAFAKKGQDAEVLSGLDITEAAQETTGISEATQESDSEEIGPETPTDSGEETWEEDG